MADNPRGRPRKLQPDEKTLVLVKGLGNIQATGPECAAVLGVTEPTWIKFKKGFPEVEAALRDGQGEGRASLRRRQFKAVGVAKAFAWLGGADRVEPEHLEVLASALWDAPEEQPEKVAQVIATEVGATTAVLDPIEGLLPGSGDDYLSVMRANLRTLKPALGCA